MYYLVHVTRSRLHLESNPYEHGYNCRIFDTSTDKIVLVTTSTGWTVVRRLLFGILTRE